MSRLDDAREVVRRWPVLPDELRQFAADPDDEDKSTAEILADSLDYLIGLSEEPLRDESKVELGASKYKGLPHLPPDVDWPVERSPGVSQSFSLYFLAQFNLAELHPFDLHDAFPATGMLYLFCDTAAAVTVLHYSGPLDALRVTPYPDADMLLGAEHYLADFIKESALIDFVPEGIFYLGDGDVYDYSEVAKLLPEELKDQVETALGAPLTDSDTAIRIFGRPICWQGVEELDGYDDMLVDQGALSQAEVDRRCETRILLFQDESGDSIVHFWVSAADAARRDYSGCWLTYSGT